ncbi:IclR family transcriptional regulator [Puteibacter caeruleilacunae]|nr:IclR family transcriptional regulator [Puteibacter caeruleilacunae]
MESKGQSGVSAKDKYFVPNLVKAVKLIELLADHPKGLSLTELVTLLNLPKTSLFRITNTFIHLNYLIKDNDTGKFLLSRKFLRIGLSSMGEQSIIEKAIIPMRELRDDIKETILLGALMDREAVLLEQVMGTHPFTFFLKPGKHFNLHASAPGKAILAFLDEKERNRVLNRMEFTRFNQNTITSLEKFREELEITRKRGYSLDCAEEMIGVHCVGAPILDQNGVVLAAIWTTGPSGRISVDDFETIGQKMMACANKISRSFGYNL